MEILFPFQKYRHTQVTLCLISDTMSSKALCGIIEAIHWDSSYLFIPEFNLQSQTLDIMKTFLEISLQLRL